MTSASFGPFSERKAAQTAAYFLHRANGQLNVLKLMKLMYLAERESLRQFAEPIVGDKLACLDHGPILSITLDLTNGFVESAEGDWEEWISDRAEHNVALKDPSVIRSPEEDLLALSESDLFILEQVWDKFGHWNKWKLRDYTHGDDCPEWENPQGSSTWIEPKTLLAHLSYEPEQASAIVDRLNDQTELAAAFEQTP